MNSSAEISDCGRYRWWLRRSWREGGGVVCFVMLNPSTADGDFDDPTIRRCIAFAKAWGFSTLSVRNLFALRATNPDDLWSAASPTGGYRGDTELAVARSAHKVVAAWGSHAPDWRIDQAMKLLAGPQLWCLGTTKDGKPRHPLYVRKSQELIPFPSLEAAAR